MDCNSARGDEPFEAFPDKRPWAGRGDGMKTAAPSAAPGPKYGEEQTTLGLFHSQRAQQGFFSPKYITQFRAEKPDPRSVYFSSLIIKWVWAQWRQLWVPEFKGGASCLCQEHVALPQGGFCPLLPLNSILSLRFSIPPSEGLWRKYSFAKALSEALSSVWDFSCRTAMS